MDLEVERLRERNELVAVEDLRLHAVAVDEPQRIRMALGLELAQDAHDRRKAHPAGDEDGALGLAARRDEVAVRTVDIGARSDRDGADAIGKVAALLDRKGDTRLLDWGRTDRERMLGQTERPMAEVDVVDGGRSRRRIAVR